MVINDLNTSSHADGKSLSAYQGYLLNTSKTGLTAFRGPEGTTTGTFVKDLKFKVINVWCNNSNQEYSVNYSGINVVTSFILGCANTSSNANIESIVPISNQSDNGYRIINVKSRHATGNTLVFIGVFYY